MDTHLTTDDIHILENICILENRLEGFSITETPVLRASSIASEEEVPDLKEDLQSVGAPDTPIPECYCSNDHYSSAEFVTSQLSGHEQEAGSSSRDIFAPARVRHSMRVFNIQTESGKQRAFIVAEMPAYGLMD